MQDTVTKQSPMHLFVTEVCQMFAVNLLALYNHFEPRKACDAKEKCNAIELAGAWSAHTSMESLPLFSVSCTNLVLQYLCSWLLQNNVIC